MCISFFFFISVVDDDDEDILENYRWLMMLRVESCYIHDVLVLLFLFMKIEQCIIIVQTRKWLNIIEKTHWEKSKIDNFFFFVHAD